MDDYEITIALMEKLFSRDYQFAMATDVSGVPSIRFVDTYFDDGVFYIVTHTNANKAKEIAINPNMALCSRKGHSFKGKAYNIGHPLLPENTEIRIKLIKAFEAWYFNHNDENDDICILKIVLESGFFHKDGIGYKIDFINETVEKIPFVFDTVLTEE